jgi:hypothetical protein
MGSIIAAGQIKGEFGPKESRAEQESRLRLNEQSAQHERRKEVLILYATLLGLGVVIIVCLIVALTSRSPEKSKVGDVDCLLRRRIRVGLSRPGARWRKWRVTNLSANHLKVIPTECVDESQRSNGLRSHAE